MTFGPTFEPEEATAQAGTVVFFLRNDKGDGPPALHNFLLGASVEDPPLARSLYASVEVDDIIPPNHYEAVARIIGFVMNGARRAESQRARPLR